MNNLSNVSAAQATSYYERDDYYTEGGHMPCRFGGELAREIGLEPGTFDLQKFHSALRGKFEVELKQARDGERAGKRAGLDSVFSAPKSVSIMALVKGDRRLIDAHSRACEAAMSEFAKLAGCRVTENKKTLSERSESGIAYASFLHDTSRAGDPNLHTHNVILNIVRNSKGEYLALDNRQMFKAQRLMDEIYKSELAREAQALGYEIDMTKDGFELCGVDRGTILEFSQRLKAIDERLAEQGQDRTSANGHARDVAAVDTRDKKRHFDRAALSAWWNERAAQLGQLPEIPTQGLSIEQQTSRAREALADASLGLAIDHHLTRQSVISSEYSLLAEAMKASEGRLTIAEARAALTRALGEGRLLAGQGRNGRCYTSPEILQREQRIAQAYDLSRGTAAPIATADQIRTAISALEARLGGTLSDGQRKMVEEICSGRNGIVAVVGDAGTGKSTAAEAAKLAAQAAIWKVYGLAPTSQAVESLAKTGIETRTSQGAKDSEKFWASLDRRSVVVLDEAGLIDAKTLDKIIKKCAERGARLVLVGDHKQFSSVEAGRPFDQIRLAADKHGEVVGLDAMQRWKTAPVWKYEKACTEAAEQGKEPPKMPEAVRKAYELRDLHFASRDDPKVAFDKLLAQDDTRFYQTDTARRGAIARDYLAMSPEDRRETLVITGKNADRIEINKAIREKLGLAGKGVEVETFEAADLTRAQTLQIGSYQVGDGIKFNRGKDGFKPGELVRVVERQADRLIVERADGTRADFRPNKQGGEGVAAGTFEKAEIADGERVRFTAIDKARGIATGDRGTVTKIDGDTLTVKLDKGETIQIPRKGTQYLRHGYAQTGHSAQGATAKYVFLHMTSKDGTIDRASFYTNLTRSAQNVRLYTNLRKGEEHTKTNAKGAKTKTQTGKLREAVGREKVEELASDLKLDRPIEKNTTQDKDQDHDRPGSTSLHPTHFADAPALPAAIVAGRMRELPSLDLARDSRQGGELLHQPVPGHLDDRRNKPDPVLRREDTRVDRAGEAQAGAGKVKPPVEQPKKQDAASLFARSQQQTQQQEAHKQGGFAELAKRAREEAAREVKEAEAANQQRHEKKPSDGPSFDR